ncbi:uracil phosphoribosyltransferase [Sulfurihydrogenibium sp.]|uniref:uracil phosphoribosyltransferase n=1 Tax=Sulfurihydrogenibium sp. TaxID=2053621 RepID=UPI0026308C5E|nr:uracil phosphoribosyltransferase [Sulfurihydrogenibium sp.]
MENVIVVNNPILQTSLTKIRDKNLKSSLVRKHLSVIGKILLTQALKDEETYLKEVETQFSKGDFPTLKEDNYVIVPILRAGLPMMDGCLEILEEAKVGFLAIKRDEETLESKVYYERLPNLKDKTVIVVDPMVATGGSLIKAIEIIKSHNPKKIISLNVIASKIGIEKVSNHKDVLFYVGSVDEKLNDKGYIVPGIGDAGDRCFNTE